MGVTFGNRLRDHRKNREESQRELASYCGLDFVVLSKIENDHAAPPPSPGRQLLYRALHLAETDIMEMEELAAQPFTPAPASPGLIVCGHVSPEERLRREERRLAEWNRMAGGGS